MRKGYYRNGTRSAEYIAWANMIQRCTDPHATRFAEYGGRGVTVCERWMMFDNFLADMGPKPGPEYSIERIDNAGNYEPGNCRWATIREQTRNRRSNVRIEFGGVTRVLTDWAAELGIDPGTLQSRLKRGWPVERALTMPTAKVRGEQHYAKLQPERVARGEHQGAARLRAEQVREIRRRAASESQTSIASEFGVDRTTIRCIVTGKTWRHLLNEETV